jgi:predicted nucleotidyltransferase
VAKKIPKKVEHILAEAKSQLCALYPDRLKEIILFGSYARGDFQKGSDIDLLLLLDGISPTLPERDQYFSVVCDLSLKYDTVVSVIPMDIETFETRKSPLILNIRKEGRQI